MPSEKEKPRIAITIDPVLLNWIDDQIKEKRFGSRSHAIEFSVNSLRNMPPLDELDKNILVAIRDRQSPNPVKVEDIVGNVKKEFGLKRAECQDRLQMMKDKGYVEVFGDPINSAILTAKGRQYLRANP